MISGLVLKYLNRDRFVILKRSEATLPGLSQFRMTKPARTLSHGFRLSLAARLVRLMHRITLQDLPENQAGSSQAV